MSLINQARDFAFRAHFGQKRKYTDLPYYTHVSQVADFVFDYSNSEEMIAAAYLHDTLEDTETTVASLIKAEFPEEVIHLVIELTDVYTKENFPDFNRHQRKKLEAVRLGTISDEAKTIKLADILSNTADITQHDPNFAAVYLDEKRFLVPRLIGGDKELWDAVWSQVNP